MEVHEFVEACRFIGRTLGQADDRLLLSNRVACHFRYDQDAIFYQDANMLIGVGTQDLGLVVERLENGNPVVCVKANGERIRWHGEACYLYAPVRELLAHIIGQ